MEIVLFLSMLLPITMLGYCFVRDKQEEDEAAGDPVKTYYLERKRWYNSIKLSDGKAFCPNYRCAGHTLIDMDNILEWMGPEEARLIKINPKDRNSPTVKAKYKCNNCGFMR